MLFGVILGSFLVDVRVALSTFPLEGSPGLLRDRFWVHFGAIWGSCLEKIWGDF